MTVMHVTEENSSTRELRQLVVRMQCTQQGGNELEGRREAQGKECEKCRH